MSSVLVQLNHHYCCHGHESLGVGRGHFTLFLLLSAGFSLPMLTKRGIKTSTQVRW